MADRIHLTVLTQAETVFDQRVKYVNLPTSFGSVGILTGHAPMLCAVEEGNVKCSFEEGGGYLIRVGKGIANVADNEVTLMVSEASILE